MIDMHTHTTYSDGELTPNELVKYAIEKGITTLSITDHNTLNGIRKVNKNEPIIINNGIKIIDGIEMSIKTSKGRMHILGYGIDILSNNSLNKKLNELRDNSMNATLSLMKQIKRDYGITFGYEDIKNMINADHNLGKPDLAKLCVKYGYANTIKEAFDKYLLSSYEKIRGNNKGINYEECIDLILQSGGIPVLAHPVSLDLDDKELLILLKDMISVGLQGIEVYHSNHSYEQMDKYLSMANKLNLLISGGSDYHGPIIKPDIDIGIGKFNLKIKELSILNKLNNK